MRRKQNHVFVWLMVISSGLAALAPCAVATADPGEWSILDVGAGDRPSSRKHHSMVYDPICNRVILYGGEEPNGSQPLGDLWVLSLGSSPAWEEVTPDLAEGLQDPPPGLHGHSAAYDPVNRQMLLVNGRIDTGTPTSSSFSSTVWALSLDDLSCQNEFEWSIHSSLDTGEFKSCPLAPSSCKAPYGLRTHGAAAYLAGSLYSMGGQAFAGQYAMEDTWSVPLTGSTWVNKSGGLHAAVFATCEQCLGVVPDRRYWHSMITDTTYHRLVVFGGIYPDGGKGDISNTFVTSNGSVWTDLGDAPNGFSRNFHSAVYDEQRKRMVVLGGYSGFVSGLPVDIVDGVTALDLPVALDGDWELLQPCGTGPGYFAEHSAAYDSAGDRVVVFGGVESGGIFRGDDTYVLTFGDEPPAAVTLSLGKAGRVSSTITWTAPGDDGNVGTAASYDLRRSTSPINEASFSSATPVATDPPSSAGTSECATSYDLTRCQTYYYALKTLDTCGNWSPMSNVLSIQQKCGGPSFVCAGSGF